MNMKKYVGAFVITLSLLSNMQAKKLENTKVVFIDKLMALKPKGYGDLIKAARVAKELYATIAHIQTIAAADMKALEAIVKAADDSNTSDFCKALGVAATKVTVTVESDAVLGAEIDKQAVSLLITHMLDGFGRFLEDIYSDKCRKFLKPSFEESLTRALGEEVLKDSILFSSLDKNDEEVEGYYRETITSLAKLKSTLKDLLVFLRDLAESLPRGREACMKLVRQARSR
jgi:hypothetical protein